MVLCGAHSFPYDYPPFLASLVYWSLHRNLDFTPQSCTVYSSVTGHEGSLTALPGPNIFREPWCKPPQPSHTYILRAYKTEAGGECQDLLTAQDVI